jgi:hypothetical protein
VFRCFKGVKGQQGPIVFTCIVAVACKIGLVLANLSRFNSVEAAIINGQAEG